MSLDITFTRRERIVCPKCGETVGGADVDSASSGGRVWYDFLEAIGYYVPYDKLTEENDWYGKNMALTREQLTRAYQFVKKHELYSCCEIQRLLAIALAENSVVVVNANW